MNKKWLFIGLSVFLVAFVVLLYTGMIKVNAAEPSGTMQQQYDELSKEYENLLSEYNELVKTPLPETEKKDLSGISSEIENLKNQIDSVNKNNAATEEEQKKISEQVTDLRVLIKEREMMIAEASVQESPDVEPEITEIPEIEDVVLPETWSVEEETKYINEVISICDGKLADSTITASSKEYIINITLDEINSLQNDEVAELVADKKAYYEDIKASLERVSGNDAKEEVIKTVIESETISDKLSDEAQQEVDEAQEKINSLLAEKEMLEQELIKKAEAEIENEEMSKSGITKATEAIGNIGVTIKNTVVETFTKAFEGEAKSIIIICVSLAVIVLAVWLLIRRAVIKKRQIKKLEEL